MTLLDLFPPILDLKSDNVTRIESISALHSGNIGDIIYSLPTAYALGTTHYILNICSDPGFSCRILTREAALKLAPLLLGQGTIRRVSVIRSQIPLEFAEPDRLGINHILDVFRTSSAELHFHLAYRHAHPFGIRVDGSRRWLESESVREGDLPPGILSPYLVVGLTGRYRRWGDDYYATLLQDVPADRVVFVGVEEDLWQKTNVPGAFLKPSDFTQLARVLKGSALFIGNPSFPYAVAEALKVPRMVELAEGINVAPLDPSGIPLHVNSIASLRGMIFEAIDHEPSNWVKLTSQIDELTTRLIALENEKKALELQTIDARSLVGDRENAIGRLSEDWNELQEKLELAQRRLESKTFLLKSLIREIARSNRLSRSLHEMLSKITPLRRLWRSLGPS